MMLMNHTTSAVSIFESSPPWASRPFSLLDGLYSRSILRAVLRFVFLGVPDL